MTTRRWPLRTDIVLLNSSILLAVLLGVGLTRAQICAQDEFQKGGYNLGLGAGFTCGLLQGGNVKCWGDNTFGQLGVGDTQRRGGQASDMGDTLPAVDLGPETKAVALAAAWQHTCALLDDGAVKCWGQGSLARGVAEDAGRLGMGPATDGNHIGDEPMELGENLRPVSLGAGRKASSVAVGQHFTCVILDDGAVKCWGPVGVGLGIPSYFVEDIPNVDLGVGRSAVAIAVGDYHACAILDTGNVTCWGANDDGQLGRVGEGVVDFGESATSIAARKNHTCVVLAGGDVACWGGNEHGQLGQGNTNRQGTPRVVALGAGSKATSLAVGQDHVCVVLQSTQGGAIKCWGRNNAGQLGQGDREDRGDDNDEMGDALAVVDLGPGAQAVSVGAGERHTCAVLSNASIICWGDNTAGVLGFGVNPGPLGASRNANGTELGKVDVGSTESPSVVVGGFSTTFAIMTTGGLKAWGRNENGLLGLGDEEFRGDSEGETVESLPFVDVGSGRTTSKVGSGRIHTCALLDDGSVKCWGAGSFGVLGSGEVRSLGDEDDEMGDSLAVVPLGTAEHASAVDLAVGGFHSCVVLLSGDVKWQVCWVLTRDDGSWGYNQHGQLGLEDTLNRGGDVNGAMGDSLPVVNLGSGRTAKAITAGMRHTCAVLDDDTVKCWGENGHGELGLGDQVTRGSSAGSMGDALPVVDLGGSGQVASIEAGSHHTCARTDTNAVKCWGENSAGSLGIGATQDRGARANDMGDMLPTVDLGAGRTALAIAAGGQHSCAVLDDGSLRCWGRNDVGQLGQGDSSNRGDQGGEMGSALPALQVGGSVASVACGDEHTCAVLSDGSLKCWGANLAGELGLGRSQLVGDADGEMGAALGEVDVGSEAATVPACAACSRADWHCQVGYGLGTCGAWMDAQCVPCASKPDNAAYVSGCAWICDEGYTVDGDECRACACGPEQYLDDSLQVNASARPGCPPCRQCSGNCTADEQEVQACSGGGDRVCEECPAHTSALQCAAGQYTMHCVCTDCPSLPANALWTTECGWQCANDFVVAAAGRQCIRKLGLTFDARLGVNSSVYYSKQAEYVEVVSTIAEVEPRKIAVLRVVDVITGRRSVRTVLVETMVAAATDAEEDVIRGKLTQQKLSEALAAVNLPLTALDVEEAIAPPPPPPDVDDSAGPHGHAHSTLKLALPLAAVVCSILSVKAR